MDSSEGRPVAPPAAGKSSSAASPESLPEIPLRLDPTPRSARSSRRPLQALLYPGAPAPQPLPTHDPVVPHIKPELRLLLALWSQLLSQLRNFLRQPWLLHRLRRRLSCGCPRFRTGIFIPAVFPSSYRCVLSTRPLGSIRVAGLPRYYGPLRLPPRPPRRLCLPAARGSLSLPPRRASQAPRPIFPRALSPTTPEGPAGAPACHFPTGVFRLQLVRKTGRLRLSNEAESSSLALRLACSPPEPHWLPYGNPRSFGYMSNRQFTW